MIMLWWIIYVALSGIDTWFYQITVVVYWYYTCSCFCWVHDIFQRLWQTSSTGELVWIPSWWSGSWKTLRSNTKQAIKNNMSTYKLKSTKKRIVTLIWNLSRLKDTWISISLLHSCTIFPKHESEDYFYDKVSHIHTHVVLRIIHFKVI